MKFKAIGNLIVAEKGKKSRELKSGDSVELSQDYIDANPHVLAHLELVGGEAEGKAEKKPEAKAEPKSDDKKFEKKKPTKASFTKKKPVKVPAKAKKVSKKKG